MADSYISKENVGDEVPGKQTFAVSEKLCQPCCNAGKRTVAEDWCLDCSEYLCSACSKTHLQFTILKDHKIVAAGDADRSSVSCDMKGRDRCKEHSKTIKFVCEDDDMLCCSTCAIAKHRKCHNVQEIENKAKTSSADLTSVRQDLLDIKSKVKVYAQRLMRIRGKITADTTEITNKIQKMQDKVNEMFDNLKRNVAKEIDSFQKQSFQDLDMKNEICLSNVTFLTEALLDVDNARQQGTLPQQFIMAHHLKGHVAALKAKIDQDISDLQAINMSFDFDQSIQLPPVNNTTPGKLKMKCVHTDVITSVDSINSQQEDQKVKLTLLASIDLKQGEGDVMVPMYSGLDFLSDRRLVAVDNWNTKCLVYNQKLEKVGSVLLPGHLFDVTVMNDKNVAVSGGRKIFFINISELSDITVTRTLNVTMNCYSIGMMTDDSFLIGCYDDPQLVRVVSVEGEERPLAINFSAKQYKLEDLACTHIKNVKRLHFLTDSCTPFTSMT